MVLWRVLLVNSSKVKSHVFDNMPASHQALLIWAQKQTGETLETIHCDGGNKDTWRRVTSIRKERAPS